MAGCPTVYGSISPRNVGPVSGGSEVALIVATIWPKGGEKDALDVSPQGLKRGTRLTMDMSPGAEGGKKDALNLSPGTDMGGRGHIGRVPMGG